MERGVFIGFVDISCFELTRCAALVAGFNIVGTVFNAVASSSG
jgi:hypothetical protein